MSTITCAISGIKFKTDYLGELTISHTAGYFHPVFACNHKQLHALYSLHTRGKLAPTDSYLLFLAFLNSTDKIDWQHPVTLDPIAAKTRQLIEINICQLVSVIARTDTILHPHFKQPDYKIYLANSDLSNVGSYISAWEDNIDWWYSNRAEEQEIRDLQKVENYLSTLILSGEKVERYSHVVADWADIAATFPTDRREEWKRVIRTCFNVTKMFNTPLSLLKEIKDYCECNIDVGSIHFHTLSLVLKKGISCHIDYLGGSSLALGYEILPELADSDTLASIVKNEEAISNIIAKAPKNAPVRTDYSDSMAFLRAKLAYRVAASNKVAIPKMSDTIENTEPSISLDSDDLSNLSIEEL
jgi:hypothetical protein